MDTAIQRASELFFKTPGNLVPENAKKYRDHMCRKYAGCGEVILTAFAHYAQIDEGLVCDDTLYKVSDEDRREYALAIA